MIHQMSFVSPEAQIAESAEIGPFVTIERNVVIGEGTRVMSGAVICEGTRIGKNCRIFPNAVIGAVPQDLKFVGEETTCEIGDNNTIREFVTINRGTASKNRTVVGNNNLLMAYVHVGHDCVLGNNLIISNACQFAGEVEINDFAVVGGGSLVHQFTRIGSYVMVQGGTRVGKDMPPFAMVGRDPATCEGINLIGMKRRGFNEQQIAEVQEIYRYLYQRNLNTTQALNAIEAELPQSELRDKIVNFIRTSQRGIIRGAK
ncbi:MAG: acyl-ACP--UDP-N-acetylglucosamine O-acyltransferase [Marinilabiliaceae bacterium]|nr:acyl-ACP--UDP-N-acetylglucosamine O-acyltransferase [Marinilabiliaceae bacterium]